MDLSIIILNFNTRDLLKQTLESIKTKAKVEVIVVDNASQDDSVAMVKKHFPKVKLIRCKKNKGFAVGNNLGLKQARGKYLMMLNSDTKLEPKCLDKLLAYMDKHPEVGIVTPKLVLENGQLDPACRRGLPTLWSAFTYFSNLEKLFPKNQLFGTYHLTWLDIAKTHPVEAVSGAAMLFRSTVVEDIGYLDEQFFMYAEDIDFCKRALDAGWQIIYYPDAQVVHYKGQSGTHSFSPQVRHKTRQYFYTTMKQYFRKHYTNRYPDWVLKIIDGSIDIVARIKG